MAPSPTREQHIKRGKRLRQAAALFFKLQQTVTRGNPGGEEVWLDTGLGKVRTLWYGLENSQPAPLYFDLHGGGFLLGTAAMDDEMNLELQGRVGCKIISINYAKAPDLPYPAAVDQVYAVVGHVAENAEKYGIDRGRMAIGGHSAGANLSTVTCMKAKKEGTFQFVCQILDYPPLDLATDPRDKPRPKGAISPSMAATFNACYVDPDQARDPYVSPLFAPPQDLAGLTGNAPVADVVQVPS